MATATQEKETQSRPWYRRDPWLDRLPRPLARLERDFEQLMDASSAEKRTATPAGRVLSPPSI